MLQTNPGLNQMITGLILLISCFIPKIPHAFITPALSKSARYAPNVVSIIQDHTYLRTHEAPIYWKISPYYLPQLTNASCSLATAIMVLNALRIPYTHHANQTLISTTSALHQINKSWANNIKQDGIGISLDQFYLFFKQIIAIYQLPSIKLQIIHATKTKDVASIFHQALIESEKTGRTFIIVNFDQKSIIGTESIGHFAPVGAYDEKTKRVLIMDPDRELFEPYWIPEERLLNSMRTNDSETRKNRGFIVINEKQSS